MMQTQKTMYLLIAENDAGDNPRRHKGDVENAMPLLLVYYIFLQKLWRFVSHCAILYGKITAEEGSLVWHVPCHPISHVGLI